MLNNKETVTKNIKSLKNALEDINKFKETIDCLSGGEYIKILEYLNSTNLSNIDEIVNDITNEINNVISFMNKINS